MSENKMRIDIESFQFIWEQIEKKLEEISTIPKYRLPSGRLKDFIGYEIDSTGITFKTEQYQYGDTDSESFQVAWHEFNQPLEYFKSKFQKEIEKNFTNWIEDRRIEKLSGKKS
jgi:hypothetical protein